MADLEQTALAPDPIRCDGCGTHGRRRIGFAVPDFWFFIETKIGRSDRFYIVYACSETCRDSMWRPASEAPLIDESDRTRQLQREQQKGMHRG